MQVTFDVSLEEKMWRHTHKNTWLVKSA